jgi:hypothetical protein
MTHPQHPTLDSRATEFLRLLASEERLLGEAVATQREVHAALRRGDVAAVTAAQQTQEKLAVALREAAAPREAAARELAALVGLAPDGLTLSLLADRLPEPWAAEVRAARDRLQAAAGEFGELQARNANLVGYLRSYFRGVLSDLTDGGAPARYGPSGGRVAPASGAAIRASG